MDPHILEYQSFSDHCPILLYWTQPSLNKNGENQSFRDLQFVKDKQSPAMYIAICNPN